MSTTDSVAFDIEKQGAVLGWCLKSPPFFFKFQTVAKETWFLDPSHAGIFKAIKDIFFKTRRVPTQDEVQNWQGFKDQDELNRTRIKTALQRAVDKSITYGLDILQKELDQWIMATILVDTLTKANQSFNKKDLENAFRNVKDAVSRIESSSFSRGVSEGFKSSQERIIEEEQLRAQDEGKLLPYGISVLDRALGGIMPKDLIIIGSETGAGKCLGLGTEVLMFDGTIRKVEEVQTGELLMGPDSLPRKVLGTTRGKGPLYRIKPVKGKPWICNDVHVMTTVDSRNSIVRDTPLNQLIQKDKTFQIHQKLFTVPVEFFTNAELSVDPYFLGIWFGDGGKSTVFLRRLGIEALEKIIISKPDPEIEAECRFQAQKWGLEVRIDYQDDEKRCPSFNLVDRKEGWNQNRNPLLKEFRKLIGPDIRIPIHYLTSSRENRLQLLAGILDTDGHQTHGYFEIVQENQGLARDIAFLARSLGFRVTETIKVVNGKSYQRMAIIGDGSVIPNRIPRKKAPVRKQIKNPLRTGFKVEAIGLGEFAGFELDGDGRFLLGDFTVTHNTSAITSISMANGQDTSNPGNVYVFALEAEEAEIEMRIKYSILSQEYFRQPQKTHRPISYRLWRQNKLQDVFGPMEKAMRDVFRNAVKGIQTLYRKGGDFTVDNLTQKIEEVRHDAKLIIVDHLHYIDYDDKTEENRAHTKIAKEVRDSVLTLGIPTILVAHLRKLEQGKSKLLMPNIADFHGSSNITKIATACILLARHEDGIPSAPRLSPTFIKIVKSRLEGDLFRFTNLIEYNTKTNLFEPTYKVGKLIDGGKEWEQMVTNLPYWAEMMEEGEVY